VSQDVGVNCHTCGTALNDKTTLPGGLQPLFEELGAPVGDWRGKTGVAVLPALQSAVKALEDPDDRQWWREKHDGKPGDTWSRVDFAVEFLTSMRDAVCRDPYATINVS